MLKSDLEKLNKSELITLLIECEENRREEKKEMKVGDIIILKNPIKQMGMSKYHEALQINAQYGDMAFVTLVRCVPTYQHDESHDDWENYDEPHVFRRHARYVSDRGRHVKYNVIFDTNERSCWEYKDALYENYEKFDKDKMYKLWLWSWIARNIPILGYYSDKRLSRDLKVT